MPALATLMAKSTKFKNLCGGTIRQLRIQSPKGMTQEELVQKLFNMGVDLDRTALSRIENQQRPISDIELFAICYALKVSPAMVTAAPELQQYFARLYPEAGLLVAETQDPPFGVETGHA